MPPGSRLHDRTRTIETATHDIYSRIGDRNSFDLHLFGVVLRFCSVRGNFLEHCLKLHYGNRILPADDNSNESVFSLEFLETDDEELPLPGDDNICIPLRGATGDIVMMCDMETHRCTIELPGVPPDNPAEVFFSAITSFIGHVMKSKNILFIHASSVIYDGKGIMFCGENMSGKSTLMRAMLENDAEYMSDDSAAVGFDKHTPMLLRNSELLNAADLSEKCGGRLLAKGFTYFHEGLFMSPPPDCVAACVDFVFFPSIMQARHGIISLSKKKAVLKLLNLHRTPLIEADYERYLLRCDNIASSASCFELRIQAGKETPVNEIINICK